MSGKQGEWCRIGLNGGVCERECMGRILILTRCRSCGLPQLYEVLEWKSVCGRAYNLEVIKWKISFFLFILKLRFSFTVAYFMS